jgi:hypothetical protein
MSIGAAATSSIQPPVRTLFPGDDFEGWVAATRRESPSAAAGAATCAATTRTLLPGDDMEGWSESVNKIEGGSFWGKEGFSFRQALDTINPLHHLPVIGTIYRAITGETVTPGARIVGGMVFGGPLGLASAVVDSIVEDTTGKSMGGHVVAALGIGSTEPAPAAAATAIAAAAPAVAPTAPPAPAPARVATASPLVPRVGPLANPYDFQLPPSLTAAKPRGDQPLETEPNKRAEAYSAAELLSIFKRYQQAGQLAVAGEGERPKANEDRL